MVCRSSWRSFFGFQTAVIDNYVFRLHYMVTLPILLILSIIVAFRQQFGTAIGCLTNDIAHDIINNYCYTHSTFTIAEAWSKKVGGEVPYPGIQKYSEDETREYHTYYQWVAIVLFLQALVFYVPRLLWKILEQGRIDEMVEMLHQSDSENVRRGNVEKLADVLAGNFNGHGIYFASYCATEVINGINIIAQMSLMNAFLGGAFWSYGLKAMKQTDGEWTEMYRVFPLMTKCMYRRYGASGTVQRNDALCHMDINVLNQKIYLFLWFWFVIMIVLSSLAIVYRILVFLLPQVRFLMFKLCAPKRVNRDNLKTIIQRCDVGDWFVIRLLYKNLSSVNFRDLVSILTVMLVEKQERERSIKLEDILAD